MDAVRGVELSGYEDRQLVKDFLAVSLAKSQPEKQIFENCFEISSTLKAWAARMLFLRIRSEYLQNI